MVDKRQVGHLRHISPNKIERNPDNPRLVFRQEEMESLLLSIDKHGIRVPLAVYPHGDNYRLLDGERRWRCALKLNLPTVPAIVEDEPSPLENLLLMYNIHALREQWDYFTIASKLTRVIELFEDERGSKPNEIELSEATGLTRSQIRRCRLLIDLPDRFKDLLLKELELPKLQQQLSEDFFIEMERSLKTVVARLPRYEPHIDEIRDTLIGKFRRGTIEAITDFRQLSKIATAVDNLGLAQRQAQRSLDKVFNPKDGTGIRQAYQQTVEFGYDEQKAIRQIEFLQSFFDDILKDGQTQQLDDEFLKSLERLYRRISDLLRLRR